VTVICKVEGCGAPARYVATCMCQKHNWRLRKHGSTDAPVRKVLPLAEKIRRGLEAGLALAEEVGDCLEWQGYFQCKGDTPSIKVHDPDKKRTDNYSVPKLLWERKHGPVPKGKLVYRKCCNNACVLDDHLACGTRKDWADARKKAGTTKHSHATLVRLTMAARRRANTTTTMETARTVRSLSAGKVRIRDIAEQTGLAPCTVADIRQGRSWRELSSPFAGLGGRA
jgi:hypothetical protein